MIREPNAAVATKESEKRTLGGQPGNTNAIELSGHKPHQRSAKHHEALD